MSANQLQKCVVPERVRQWIRPEIQALSAYHVPPARGFVKLDAMENPYHWPEEMVVRWQALLAQAELNRYPDPSSAGLKAQLRRSMGLAGDAPILLGNGSDELIQMVAMAVSGPGRKIMSVEPGFVMYQMIARFVGMDYVGVALNEDFTLDVAACLRALEQEQPAVVFIAYPNNPTGNLFEPDDIAQIIDAAPGLVVIDEAYHAFAGDSFVGQLQQYEHVLLMRTVSKMGLAGLRLGYMVGPAHWLEQIDKVRMPYNVNVLTQLTAEFALEHESVLLEQTQQICRNRSALLDAMRTIAGIDVFDSRANFILFRSRDIAAAQLFDSIKSQGVLIKNMDPQGGLLQQCLRVTVSTEQENQAFLVALRQALQA